MDVRDWFIPVGEGINNRVERGSIVERVYQTLSTSGCALRGPPASAPSPVTTFSAPGGRPASVSNSVFMGVLIECVDGECQ